MPRSLQVITHLRHLAVLLLCAFLGVGQAGAGSMMLLGAGGASAATPFGITNTDFSYDLTSQTTYTYSSLSIGAANASRVVVIACLSRQAGTVGAASSATIGGSSANLVVQGASTGTTSTVDIWQLAVPTGTTATITITYPSAMLRAACSVYSVLGSNGSIPAAGAKTASINNAPSVSTPISGTITVPTGGGMITGGVCSANASFTATNYTKDQDTGNTTTTIVTSGHDTSHSGSTTFTTTQNIACNQPSGAFAAWGP